MMKGKFLVLLLILFALPVFFASSQVRETDLVISTLPAYPTPNQDVEVQVRTNSTDLSKAYIAWSLNGELTNAGIGQTSFAFNTEDMSRVNITAAIETVGGTNLTKSIAVNPTQVDILWEAVDSYAPPFYKGKTLVESEGLFKVVAMPSISKNGEKLNNKNLSYTWRRDRRANTNASGFGKDSFTFRHNFLDTGNTIEVLVSDILNEVSAEGNITLFPASAEILFYRKDPELGTRMERALTDNFFVDQEGETIVAMPYFISPANLASPNLRFEWSLGGSPMATPEVRNELGVKPQSGTRGSSSVGIVVSNIRALFSGAENEINVGF